MASSEEEKAFYTPDDVARLLGFSPETVREWIRDGILPAIQVRGKKGRYRIRRGDFERFLEEQSAGGKGTGA